MKRAFKIAAVLIAVILCSLSGWALLPDHSVPWDSFEAKMRDLDLGPNFHLEEMHSLPADAVPLPWSIRWNPRRWGEKKPRLLIGFPDSGAYYLFAVNGTDRLECDVRYLDSRAMFVVIHSRNGQQNIATKLRDAVAREFPGLPSKVLIE